MNRLKLLREERKLTQTEVAAFLGVGRNTLSRYETGERAPDTDTVARLAGYFDVTTDYLLGLSNERKRPDDGDDITFDDFTYAMHNEGKELTDDQREMLLEMARVMKKQLKKKDE